MALILFQIFCPTRTDTKGWFLADSDEPQLFVTRQVSYEEKNKFKVSSKKLLSEKMQKPSRSSFGSTVEAAASRVREKFPHLETMKSPFIHFWFISDSFLIHFIHFIRFWFISFISFTAGKKKRKPLRKPWVSAGPAAWMRSADPCIRLLSGNRSAAAFFLLRHISLA